MLGCITFLFSITFLFCNEIIRLPLEEGYPPSFYATRLSKGLSHCIKEKPAGSLSHDAAGRSHCNKRKAPASSGKASRGCRQVFPEDAGGGSESEGYPPPPFIFCNEI
jgi:hypothetical protein